MKEECAKLKTQNAALQAQVVQLMADACAMTALQEENRLLHKALQKQTEQRTSTSGQLNIPSETATNAPSEVTVCGEQVALDALPADLSMLSVETDDLDWSGFKRECSTSLTRRTSGVLWSTITALPAH